MVSIKTIELMVKMLQETLEKVDSIDADDLRWWWDSCNSAIRDLGSLMKKSMSRAEKQKCQSFMTNLSWIQVQLDQHLRRGAGLGHHDDIESRVQWRDVDSAFQNRIRTGVIVNIQHIDILSFMNDAQKIFKSQLQTYLNKHNSAKVNSEFVAEFVMQKQGEEVTDVKYFSSESVSIFQSTNLDEWFVTNIRDPLIQHLEEFQEKDSGWALKSILSLGVNIKKLSPIKGSAYIPLPKAIEKKRAVINVRNSDDRCFLYAILSALHPAERHANRVNKYLPYEGELNFNGIQFPVELKDVRVFEKQNDISVNVYMLRKLGQKYEVSPCHVTDKKKEKHVNLLIIQDRYIDENGDDENEDDGLTPRYHYAWIKSMSRLLSSQVSTYGHKSHHCERCLHVFYSEEKLKAHEVRCINLNKCKINLPDKKSKILKFENYYKSDKVPLVIYADFECLLKHSENGKAFQLHEAYSIGYFTKCSFDDSLSVYKSYRRGTDDDQTPAEWFVGELKSIAENLNNLYQNPKPMKLTDLEELTFQRSTSCHICRRSFREGDDRVRDHCHLTGRFRGAAHNSCNLNFKNSRYIPVIFHNLSGYDSHFIIKEVATSPHLSGRVILIPENKEKYISFSKHIDGSEINFRFLDSYRFLQSSLDKLSSYLTDVPIAIREFEKDGYSTSQINLLKRKGVFPYEYVDSLEKLQDIQLPVRSEFYSTLMDSDITEEDYMHAVNVWNMFEIETLGMYSDLYLKTDVLLLADVFESFRITCLQAYELDPAHYYTTPGLTWDAMMKYTRVELELITEIDMLMFIEEGIRGGISQCCNRYGKANNKYMGAKYDKEKKTKFLMYFDINNLYGWAMVQYLPTGNFKWVTFEDVPDFFNTPADSSIGFIAEVDLEYPEEIHDEHQDLPLCPEHRTPPGSKQRKLLTTLYNKERYIIHYRALKQALDNGLKLKKVHRILSFEQRPWLKPYVELNTEKRQQAKNEFEKLFYKLMINAVYGKTMENERKRVDVKLANKWEGRYGAEARIAQPNFHSCSIFDENLVAVQLKRTSITIKKPIYVGLCVLDLSKTLVYDFHYSYMKNVFGDMCKLLYTDTDSLIYEIEDYDIYQLIKMDNHRFDTSDYAPNNPYGIPLVNKKVLGLMKDECNGKIMLEFIGLRSKMYSILVTDSKVVKKAKGVKSNIVQKNITFEDYRRCLEDLVVLKRDQCNIRSKLHVVRTEKQQKIALSPHDDKRYLLPNSTDTLPWGHYRILEEEMLAAAEKVEREIMELEQDVEGRTVEQMPMDEELQEEFTKEWGLTQEGIAGKEEERVETDILQQAMEGAGLLVEEEERVGRDVLQQPMEGAGLLVEEEERVGRDVLQQPMEGAGLLVGEHSYKQQRQRAEDIQSTDELECRPPPRKRFNLSLKLR